MYIELSKEPLKKVHLGPARFALDLSDGSERGEYVDQDYILNKLGRPHRAINLMYCYYPLDKTWPARARDAFADQEIAFQWDYPYDDYFTYKGGLEGNSEGDPFDKMRDIRKHGQDVILTLTMDPHISDEQIRAIAKDLKPFGRMQLRINHEATGSWFTFNKRASYEEVAAFFAHATEVIHEEAPQIQTIICIGGAEDPDVILNKPLVTENDPMVMEDIFTPAVKAADIWSVDKYMALHWGWPCDVADKDTAQYKRCNVKRTYELTKMSFDRYQKITDGQNKPMVMSEFNADGDVVGPFDQIRMMQEFFQLREADSEDWLTAITFYQFRDRGRLGLEIEDPNNQNVGIEQPILKAYKKELHSKLCAPTVTAIAEQTNDNAKGLVTLDVSKERQYDKLSADTEDVMYKLRWGGSEDATGVQAHIDLEKIPTFLELYFNDVLKPCNLMMQCELYKKGAAQDDLNSLLATRWFYKAINKEFVDVMPLFFENMDAIADTDAYELRITFYAPPRHGLNEETQGEDWLTDYYTFLPTLPKLRVEYDPVLPVTEGLADGVNIELLKKIHGID